MSTYNYKITKTYHYYGYPEAEYRYSVESEFFNCTFKVLGNHGVCYPEIACKKECNGYFWSMHTFMKALFNGDVHHKLYSLKECESMTITLE